MDFVCAIPIAHQFCSVLSPTEIAHIGEQMDLHKLNLLPIPS